MIYIITGFHHENWDNTIFILPAHPKLLRDMLDQLSLAKTLKREHDVRYFASDIPDRGAWTRVTDPDAFDVAFADHFSGHLEGPPLTDLIETEAHIITDDLPLDWYAIAGVLPPAIDKKPRFGYFKYDPYEATYIDSEPGGQSTALCEDTILEALDLATRK